jgi:ATP-binding cassette, subfamily B, multidrug efflux pump
VVMATFTLSMVPRAAVSSNRIQEVLDTVSSVAPPVQSIDAPRRGVLEVRDVGFNYPGAERPVLCDVSFDATAGHTTAIIGSTGAGKTSLVNLLARLFDPTTGTVRLDGVDLRDMDPDRLWSSIGLVPQKPYLFSGTVGYNLRFGNPAADDGELWDALEVAQGADFVREKEDGLESRISQGGTNVSGGQRQRLCIARALVARPKVYLFDDSFSALDVATDARLRRALKSRTGDATVIVVAQRVSTITDADQILVLDKGRIVDRGTHEELLETSPTYQEIVESQLSVEEAA